MAETKLISTQALIAKFKEAIDQNWGYIYGKTHELWNEEKQKAYAKAKAGDSDCQNSIKYGPKWYGHYVTDCSGLFAWAFSQLGGYMYHGSNTMYNSYCVSKGALKNGKRTDGKGLKPGTAVFCYNESTKRYSHVGLYIGDGLVIEAAGAKDGVIKSKVTNSKWENWGELKGVDYASEPEPQPTPEPTPEKGYAIVTGTRLALRKEPTTSSTVLTRVNTGEKVKLITVPDDWVIVKYGSRIGFMMRKYLKEG